MPANRLQLTADDQAILAGRDGAARQAAMELTAEAAEALGATELVDVIGAHVTSAFYTGRAGLDFAEWLVKRGARVAVPTTLNTGLLDLTRTDMDARHPDAADARRLMELYVQMGARPTWTCAPYNLPGRPGLGQHVAWAESNAVAFANSVLGARTNKYGDFTDICAGLTGRVPLTGLHRDDHRFATVVVNVGAVPAALLAEDALYHVLGYHLGREVGAAIPVITGLPTSVTEDQLRAVGAAAGSSGSVTMFHVAGVTPEAPTLATALGGMPPDRELEVSVRALREARDQLSTPTLTGGLTAVAVGTPHASLGEVGRVAELIAGRRVAGSVEFYLSTSRHIAEEARRRGWLQTLERAGVEIIVDTCTYFTGFLDDRAGVMLTSSGKWAYYAPQNLGVQVAFGSIAECVESAVLGRIQRDEQLWSDDLGRLPS